jgi:hypothetical protein
MKTNARRLTLMLSTLIGFLAVSAAEPNVNPTGTWILTMSSTNTQARPTGQTLKLKLQGEHVTGTLSRNAGGKVEELTLEKGKLNGSDISFSTHHFALVYDHNVLQPTDTNKVTHSVFKGQLSGDTIKGKVEREYMGNRRTMDWEAKRVKE